MKKFFLFLLVFAISALSPLSVLAQSSRGTVTGTVQDSAGAVLAGADVTLYSPSTGVSSTLKTNSAGIYRFEAVLAGDYVVAAIAPGFAKTESPATVNVGALVGRDFKLTVGSASSTVEVSAEKSLELQTEDAGRVATISAVALAELPIVGQNSLNLILTAPGVVKSNQASGGSLDSGIGSVNGARARSNNFLIDGLQSNDISVAGPQVTITNNDELQEVNFQTSNFTAEFGRAGGAVVSQITKSGTNALHGTAAWVYRSQVMNASTNIQRINFANGSTTDLKNKFHENIPAFTIGGPVVIPHLYNGRDKTFFFGAGQFDRYLANASGAAYIVPTANGFAALQAMAATCPNVATYLALLGSARGSSGTGSSQISAALPAGLASTSCFGGARAGQNIEFGQFIRTIPEIYTDDNYLARIDHVVSPKQNMMFRFLYDKNADNIAGNVGINSQFDVPSTGKTFGVNFNHIYAIHNNWVNEFRFGYSRANIGFFIPNGLGSTTPDIGFTGASNLALSSVFPQGRISNNWQFQEAQTYTVGRHAIRGGVDILRQLAVQVAPFNSRGSVSYSVTALNNGIGVTSPISALANFIDNYGGTNPGPVNIVFGSGRYRPNLFTVAGYLQDTYKATPNLTLTYGLRYENFGQPANIFKSPAFTGYTDADATSTAKVNPDNNNFGPSVGFAYNPHVRDHGFLSGSLVVRGGYQITYDTQFNNLLSNMAAASPNALANLPAPSSSTAATPRGTSNLSAVLPTLSPTPLGPYSSISSNFRKGIRNPYYHHFSLGVQQQFPGSVVLDVAYVGSLGRQLYFTNPLNPTLPNLTTLTTAATQTVTVNGVATVVPLRLFANRGAIQVRDSGLTSNYHSLQVQVRRRPMKTVAGNLSFSSSYTWSKNLDVISETFGTNSSPQNPSRSPAFGTSLGFLDYGPSDNDRRHVSVTIVQLQARGVKNRFLDEIVGGWTFAPILSVQSGTPYTVINGFDRGLDGSASFSRPNIGNIKAPVNTRAQVVSTAVCSTGLQNPAVGTAANTGCVTANDVRFVQVASYSPSSPNMESRNSNYTTRYLNLDTNVLKTFKITERVGFELRGEFFNITNNQNFDTPPGGTGATNRNVTANTGANFLNTTILNGGSRTMRVGGKIKF